MKLYFRNKKDKRINPERKKLWHLVMAIYPYKASEKVKITE
jgi:hypothetical protein